MLKTLQIGTHWFPERAGGLERVYFELSRTLPAMGIDFRGLVAGSAQVAASTGGRIRAFCPPDRTLVERLARAHQLIRREMRTDPPHLIVGHFALYALAGIDVIGKIPFVVHFQGPWAMEAGMEGDSALGRFVRWNIERSVYKRADRFIVLSKAFAVLLAEQYRVETNRIRVIPGGVDVDRFLLPGVDQRAARMQLGWPLDRPIVLAVRRLTKRMGLEILIDATKAVVNRVPDALIMIAGKGPQHDLLSLRVREAGLEKYITFVGFVADEDLPSAYRAADLSIVPSVALEGFGLTAAESLAAGTPVLVTPIGGLPEVVADLSTNLILGSCDARDVADGIVEAINGNSRSPDASALREYARRTFAWPVIAEKVAAVYHEAAR